MNRNTQQKKAIYTALIDSGRPLSIAEILEIAQTQITGLGIATVYRNIKILHDDGEISQVNVPGQPPRWEIIPRGHHHHFLCSTCDKLFEINGCPQGLNSLLPKGYTLAEHELLLHGQCASCSKGRTRKRPTA